MIIYYHTTWTGLLPYHSNLKRFAQDAADQHWSRSCCHLHRGWAHYLHQQSGECHTRLHSKGPLTFGWGLGISGLHLNARQTVKRSSRMFCLTSEAPFPDGRDGRKVFYWTRSGWWLFRKTEQILSQGEQGEKQKKWNRIEPAGETLLTGLRAWLTLATQHRRFSNCSLKLPKLITNYLQAFRTCTLL